MAETTLPTPPAPRPGGTGPAPADPVPPLAVRPRRADLAGASHTPLVAVLLALSAGLALYTGFSHPNIWSVTLQTVSFQDGFRRRFLVGTLLRPFAEASGYDYWTYATFSFLVLAVLVGVLITAALRVRDSSRRFLVAAWFLLPTGGFLFHEVGYFDQVLYLMLFAAMGLLAKGRWIWAAALMPWAALVHEITALTVLPLFCAAAVRRLPVHKALMAVAPTALLGGAVLLGKPMEEGAIERVKAALKGANFTPRPDVYSIFERTMAENYGFYKPVEIFFFLLPLAILAVTTFALLHVVGGDRTLKSAGEGPCPRWLFVGAVASAAASPLLIAFGGWDLYRWVFLLMANFCVALWIWLGDRYDRNGQQDLTTRQFRTVVVALLVSTHVPILYMDGKHPQPMTGPAMKGSYDWYTVWDGFDHPPKK
ncbi:hypothetical protein ACIO3O_07675 [Streptomyces sp. NPDC087440]|uniref:hypothetical protein n=1 Tax=Streptomyces sp. NPDC087440 TaxID=3365790 RepID=UPI003814F52C